MNATERRKYGLTVTRINRRAEGKWLPRVKRALNVRVLATIARLRAGGVAAAREYLFGTTGNPALGEVVKRLYREVGLQHAVRVNDGLRDSMKRKTWRQLLEVKRSGRLGFNQEWIDYISTYLERNLFEKVTISIDDTTRKALLNSILRGVQEGRGVDDIIRTLGNDWPFLRYQAARIIRTEINRAANVGAMAAGSTFEFEQSKEWIAAKDDRTRGNPINGVKDHANHWALDGAVVDENGFFMDTRNGDLLAFPGDPSASAASTINCRCSIALVAKVGEDGLFIPKQAATRRITVILPSQNVNRGRNVTI